MKKLAHIVLAGFIFGIITYSPVGTKMKLIKSVHAIDNPLVCSKSQLPNTLKTLQTCLPVVKITEQKDPKPEEKKKVDPTPPVPVHQGIAVQYTPSLSPGVSLNTDIILSLINDHRQKMGLPVFEKDPKLCDIAQSRLPELPTEAANGNYHAGLRAKNLPFWITENMKIGGNEEVTVNWWLNSPIHRAAIEGDYKYSCGAAVGDISVQEFTNWVPK